MVEAGPSHGRFNVFMGFRAAKKPPLKVEILGLLLRFTRERGVH
jgi:hypothetical protein